MLLFSGCGVRVAIAMSDNSDCTQTRRSTVGGTKAFGALPKNSEQPYQLVGHLLPGLDRTAPAYRPVTPPSQSARPLSASLPEQHGDHDPLRFWRRRWHLW